MITQNSPMWGTVAFTAGTWGNSGRVGRTVRRNGFLGVIFMALFTGTYVNKVDKKGRVSLPADFRAELPEDGQRLVYVYRSPKDQALEACDKAFMQRLADSVEELAMFSDDENDLSASIVGDARRQQMDETGRISLPPEFISYAGIDERATFVGRGSRFQIWQPERFEEHARTARERARGRTLKLRRPEGM